MTKRYTQKAMTERIPAVAVKPEVHNALTEYASANGESMSNVVRRAIDFFLSHESKAMEAEARRMSDV